MKRRNLLKYASIFLLIMQQIAPVPLNVYYAETAYEQSPDGVVSDNADSTLEVPENIEEEQVEQVVSHDEEPPLESIAEDISSEIEESGQISEDNLSKETSEPRKVRLADLVTDVSLHLLDESNNAGQKINAVGETLELNTRFKVRYTFKVPEGETLKEDDILLGEGIADANFPQGYWEFFNSNGINGLASAYSFKTESVVYYGLTGDTFYGELTTSLDEIGTALGGELQFTTFGREFHIFAEKPGKADITTYVWQDGKSSDIPEELIQLFNASQENVEVNPKRTYLNWIVEITPQEPAVNEPRLYIGDEGNHSIVQDSGKFYSVANNEFKDVYIGSWYATLTTYELGKRMTDKGYFLFRTAVDEVDPNAVYRVTSILQSQSQNLLKTSRAISIDTEDTNNAQKNIPADNFISHFSIWRDAAIVPSGGTLEKADDFLMKYILAIPDDVVLNEGDRLIVSLPSTVYPHGIRNGMVISDSEGKKVAEVRANEGYEKLVFELTNYFAENTHQRFINLTFLAELSTLPGDNLLEFDYPNHKSSYKIGYVGHEPLYDHLIEKYTAPPPRILTSLLPATPDFDTETAALTSSATEPLLSFNSSLQRPTFDWVVYVNPKSLNIGDIRITDMIEDGHVLQPGSVEVRNYFYTNTKPLKDLSIIERETGFDIVISDLQDAIQINYRTEVIDENIEEFNNSITINTELQGESSASATARLNPGGKAGFKINPIELPIQATKNLSGRSLKEDEFEFELLNPTTREVIAVSRNDVNGAVRFMNIQAEQAGTYRYIIRERLVQNSTIQYDNSEFPVTVVVRQEGNALVVESITPTPTFTNRYQPLPTKYSIQAKKVVTGRALVDGEFTFELVPSVDGEATLTATNNAQGDIVFADIPATAAGTYTYTLREQAGDTPSLTYDRTEHSITVVVTDNAGQLEVESITPAPTFTNRYQPLPTKYIVRAKSVLEGKEQVEGQFTFELWSKDDMKLGTTTNDASGDITFENIQLTETGEHVFTIKEVIHPSPTITYLTEQEEVTLSVEDKNGQLVAQSAVDEVPVFYHKYKPLPVEHTLEAQVTTEGCMLITAPLKYELLDEKGEVIQTAMSNNHSVRFAPMRFEEEAVKRYILRQVPETPNERMTYTNIRPEITLTVVDNDGQLRVSQQNSEALSFINIYHPQAINYEIKAEVTFTDSDAMPAFDFVLVNEQSEVIATAQNDAQGNIKFAPVSFALEGKHQFEIKQISGKNDTIIYDTSIHKLTFEVGKAGCDWNLISTPTAPVVFNNEQVPPQSSDESSSSSSMPEPPQSSDESSSSSSIPEPPQSSDESSSSSSMPEPPQSSDESSSSSSMPEPPQSSDESSSSSSIPEPPQSSDESSSSSSMPEPPQSSDESSSSSSIPEPPQSSDESSSSSSMPEPPQSSDESSSSSSIPEPPQSSDESSSSSSMPEPPQSSDESSNSSSIPEPPQSSDESSSSSSIPEPPQSSDESSSSSSIPEPPQSSDESSNISSIPEPPSSSKKLPRTGESSRALLLMAGLLIGLAGIYGKIARKEIES